MFACNQKNVAESFLGQMAGFGLNLLDAQSYTQNRVIAREPAVTAVVDAFVRQIKRREQTHRSAKIPERQGMRLLRKHFQFAIGFRQDQRFEPLEQRRFSQRQIVEDLSERHEKAMSLPHALSQSARVAGPSPAINPRSSRDAMRR